MDKPKQDTPPRGCFRRDDGGLAMLRCPACRRENYPIAVIDGVCAWCGHDANAPRDAERKDDNE